jgi:hypothetical protein
VRPQEALELAKSLGVTVIVTEFDGDCLTLLLPNGRTMISKEPRSIEAWLQGIADGRVGCRS